MPASQIFHTAGRRLWNKIANGASARPTTLYVGLRRLDGVSGRPSDAAAADTLASNLNECSASGYARQAVTFDNTHAPESLSGADSVLTLDQVTFNFTGAQDGLTHAFIATSSDNSGTLIASAPLGATRNVVNGDSLKETFAFTLTQGA